jgi:hypothetical protein
VVLSDDFCSPAEFLWHQECLAEADRCATAGEVIRGYRCLAAGLVGVEVRQPEGRRSRQFLIERYRTALIRYAHQFGGKLLE